MTQPKKTKKENQIISNSLIEEITSKLEKDEGVRRDFEDFGRLNIDRPLPFLCVYRKPETKEDRGTANLILSEASYLVAEDENNLSALVESISKTMADKFGAFLIIEVWAADVEDDKRSDEYTTESQAKFRIFVDKSEAIPSTVETLQESLKTLDIPYFQTDVEIVTGEVGKPPKMQPLLSDEQITQLSCLKIGLEVSPIYRDAETEELYSTILRVFRRKLSKAFQQTFFEFVHVQTAERPTAPQLLGRKLVVDAVWSADAELAALGEKVNYLTAVTPVNSNQAFVEFEKNGFEGDPTFHYRLLTIDPENLKRRLYSISFDAIEDPTMAYLLRDKRIELDRQITLIEDRNTPQFLYESLQLFPPVEDELMALAEKILSIPKSSADKTARLDAEEVAKRARKEIEYYQNLYPKMTAKVEIRADMPSGLMVSSGNLTVGRRSSISEARINALIQHEVGTHSVTYFNGRSQPLKLLYSGLPGYEQLQEGLAVFAEYLVGGLNFARIRTLAARVIAVRHLTNGKTFAEVFDELRNKYKFTKRTSFNITMRVFRGGGLTKDAVYLRGLVEILEYLGNDGDIETLFVGKMGPEHVSIIRELQWREVLKPSPLTPRYMTFPETAERLEKVKQGMTVMDLI